MHTQNNFKNKMSNDFTQSQSLIVSPKRLIGGSSKELDLVSDMENTDEPMVVQNMRKSIIIQELCESENIKGSINYETFATELKLNEEESPTLAQDLKKKLANKGKSPMRRLKNREAEEKESVDDGRKSLPEGEK